MIAQQYLNNILYYISYIKQLLVLALISNVSQGLAQQVLL